MKQQQIFIAWINFQRRAYSMKSFFGYKLIFLPNYFKNKRFRIFDYLIKSIKTLLILLTKWPSIVWVQLPPSPLIYIVKFYKFLNPNAYVIADCHNAIIRKKWTPYFKDFKALNIFDMVIVHNHVIKALVTNHSLENKKIMVLETKPADKTLNKNQKNFSVIPNQVLIPCSFAEDEPLDIIFKTARLMPNISFIISGNISRAKGLHDLSKVPTNITLTGYLSNDEYESIFLKSAAVIGLTTENHIQLSVANEAVGFEKPMILSDTPLLKELFYKGAIYVETLNEQSIANGVVECLDNQNKLEADIRELRLERIQRWEQQAKQIRNNLLRK